MKNGNGNSTAMLGAAYSVTLSAHELDFLIGLISRAAVGNFPDQASLMRAGHLRDKLVVTKQGPAIEPVMVDAEQAQVVTVVADAEA